MNSTAPRKRVKFGDLETITVADLAVGDFLVVIPTQHGVRGMKFDLLVDEIADPDEIVWTRNARRGARRFEVASRKITTRMGVYTVPSDWNVQVRRPTA